MADALDLTGQRFGRLVVVRPGPRRRAPSGRARTTWEAVCDCGRPKVVITGDLRSGTTMSCGCYQVEVRALNGGKSRLAAPGYYAAHHRIRKARGSATCQACVGCGLPASQWSYNHDDPDELTQRLENVHGVWVVFYSPDPSHYSPLCHSCHGEFDRRHKREREALDA